MNKNLSKIFFASLLVTACTQEPAKVEYPMEKPVAGNAMFNPVSTQDVQIEDISKDKDYQAPVAVEEKTETKAEPTQVYTQSDKVGPSSEDKPEKPIEEPAAPAAIADETSSAPQTHTVKKGETLFSISRQYNIPVLPIIAANGLEQPYALKEGQEIKIPQGKFHLVKSGDTLNSVSREYGVDKAEIIKANSLKEPYNLIQGQRLQIPLASDLPKEEPAASTEAPENAQPLAETNEETATPAPSKKESDEDKNKPVSLRHPTGGVLGQIVTDANGNVVAVGKEKVTPSEEAKAESKAQAAPAKIDTEEENAKLAEKTEKTIKGEDEEKPATKAADSGKFIWPVKGKVIKKFGADSDGINIAADAGTEVKASNAGRVVYTGNSLKSYGNMVIIKHDDGLLSAYAHMNNINVKKDDKVTKGQVIGTVGSTGKVTKPQLYFAIRKGKDPKDPTSYLN